MVLSVNGWPIASLELEKWPLLLLGKTTMHFYCWRIIARRSTEGAAYNVQLLQLYYCRYLVFLRSLFSFLSSLRDLSCSCRTTDSKPSKMRLPRPPFQAQAPTQSTMRCFWTYLFVWCSNDGLEWHFRELRASSID